MYFNNLSTNNAAEDNYIMKLCKCEEDSLNYTNFLPRKFHEVAAKSFKGAVPTITAIF
jgi:hypothetical protein